MCLHENIQQFESDIDAFEKKLLEGGAEFDRQMKALDEAQKRTFAKLHKAWSEIDISTKQFQTGESGPVSAARP